MKNIDLIQCGKHGKWKPWSIVCIHLLDDPVQHWNALPQEHGKLNDWVCDRCLEDWDRMMDEHDITQVRPACVDCVESIRFMFDHDYKKGK